jgi:hypothetical protein
MKMLCRYAFITLAALTPAAAFAQGGMGGRGAMGSGSRGPSNTLPRDPGIYIPKYANAVNLLIEHRQDLSLSDSQFVHVIAMKRALDSTNASLLRKVDSVQRLFKNGTPLFSSPSPERRDSLVQAHALVSENMSAVRDNIDAARDKAYGLLSSSQLAKAQELEDKAEKAAADENERGDSPAGSRRGGRGGRPPTG